MPRLNLINLVCYLIIGHVKNNIKTTDGWYILQKAGEAMTVILFSSDHEIRVSGSHTNKNVRNESELWICGHHSYICRNHTNISLLVWLLTYICLQTIVLWSAEKKM